MIARINRRDVLLGAAAAGAASLSAPMAQAQAMLNMAEVLAAVNPLLPDLVYGSADAKVTIVEYASTTCSHCARFHNEVFPELKAKYVETGKVRFIFRNFILNPLDTAASMLSYCGPAERRGAFLEFLFKQQEKWAFTNTPLDALLQAARQAGFTQESFNACLQRQDLYGALNATKNKAADGFKVNSTPTLIINGQVHRGALSMPELDKILQPLVGA
ncbi:MAG: DsbA family protein [Hyphomicrobiales bacterium]|nr:DsbA family protein [Hyphomicrobiales bacterium]